MALLLRGRTSCSTLRLQPKTSAGATMGNLPLHPNPKHSGKAATSFMYSILKILSSNKMCEFLLSEQELHVRPQSTPIRCMA